MKLKGLNKALSSLMLATVMATSVSLVAYAVSSSDINTAISNRDYETAHNLIFTESGSGSSTNTVNISVNENNELKDFNANVMGMQCEIMNYGLNFFDRYTNNLSEGYYAIADKMYDIPTARWGGGTANLVHWLNNIGPKEDRKASYYINNLSRQKIGKLAFNPTDMGPVEFIKAIYASNPDASFMFVIPMDVQTPEETLNFTRFLLDDKNESEWGALRASYGIENPVKLLGYELGNEYYFLAEPEDGMDKNSQAYADYKAEAINNYISISKDHYKAVHDVYPDVKFYPCVNGRSERAGTHDWNSTVASELCTLPGVDGVAYHAYYGGIPWGVVGDENEIEKLQQLCVETIGRRVNIVHTEHALWSSNQGVRRLSLEAALAEASFISRMARRDDIVSADYHSYTTWGTWGFYTKSGNKFYEMGVNKVYKMFQENYGNKLVETNVTSDGHGIACWGEYLVTKAPNGNLVLSFLNNSESADMSVNLSFAKDYTLIKKSVFTAPNMASLVIDEATKDVFSLKTTYEEEEHFNNIVVPVKSVVVITLAKPGTFESHLSEEKDITMVDDDFEDYPLSQSPIYLDKTDGATSKKLCGDWKTMLHRSVVYNANSQVSVVNASGNKMVHMTPTAVSYTVSGFPLLEYDGDYSSLSNKFAIEFDVDKSSVQTGCGVKFMMHNNGNNYYVLWLNGAKDEQYLWTFAKVENGTVSYSENGEAYTDRAADPNGALHGFNHIKVEYDNGEITWTIDGKRYCQRDYDVTKTYDDPTPFTVNPKDTRIGFGCNASISNNAYIVAYYDNIKITTFGKEMEQYPVEPEYPDLQKDENSTDEFVVNGEPDDVIYVERKIKYNDDGVYQTPVPSTVRKLINKGDENATVYVSTDEYSYKKLVDLAPGEEFVNTLTAKEYSYIKIDGCQDVEVYTDLNSSEVFTAEKDYGKISARIGGSEENITYSSSNRNIALIEDGYFIPLRNGVATITATNGAESVSKEVNVKKFGEYYDDFKTYEKDVDYVTPVGNAVRKISAFGDWAISQESGTVSSVPKVYVSNDGMVITANHIDPFYGSVCYTRYEGDLSGLTDKHTYEIKIDKNSVMSGLMIKFYMHNEDKSFYLLDIEGKNSTMNVWAFYKIESGRVVYSTFGEKFADYTTDRNGPLHGIATITISVDGNKIDWSIVGRRYNNRKYTGGGTYEDPEPFTIDPRNTTFGLATYAEYDVRTVTVKSIKLTGDTSDKTILQSPINESMYVDTSGMLGSPVLLFKGDGKFYVLKDNVGDGFINVPKSTYDGKYTSMYLWDLETLKPKTSPVDLTIK